MLKVYLGASAMSFEFITSLKRLDRTEKRRSVGFIPFTEAK